MQAVILVGGLGSRLRPLTSTIPKPMLPLFNKPFIGYIIDLLAAHDIKDIILSTGYLPGAFQCLADDFACDGVRVRCVTEEEPLGTCGAVKNVESMLEGTFVVFNGDILTNINISRLVEYHREKKALATLALTPVEDPTAYGLVPIRKNGSVEAFLEKPNWDEVTTDLINAGTYVLEPEVLSLAPKGESYSFERGLFPNLLHDSKRIFGLPGNSYWLDIGTPEKYISAHHDLLEGKMAVSFSGRESATRVWVGDDCRIDDSAHVYGPTLIGDGCRFRAHSSVVGPASLGNDCVIGDGTRIEGSVILDGARIGSSCVIRDSIIGPGAVLADKVHVTDAAVLGAGLKVGKGNMLKRGIKVWPGAVIPEETIRF